MISYQIVRECTCGVELTVDNKCPTCNEEPSECYCRSMATTLTGHHVFKGASYAGETIDFKYKQSDRLSSESP